MCQPEIQLPYGILTMAAFAVLTFLLVRLAGSRKGAGASPTSETRIVLLVMALLPLALNLEFGPQIASKLTGKPPIVEAGTLESRFGSGPNRNRLSKICVSGKCFRAPNLRGLGVEEGADGISYNVKLLFRQPANGRLILWPDTGLGGVRVKSLQICDPDWIARARLK